MLISTDDLRDRFLFNNWANKQLIDSIAEMPSPDEGIKLISHLITSQNKWLEKIKQTPGLEKITWPNDPYPMNELQQRWEDSLFRWLQYLKTTTEEELNKEINCNNDEGGSLSLSPAEIASELNFNSTHKRAQVVLMMQQQGMQTPRTDYVHYAMKKRKTVLV